MSFPKAKPYRNKKYLAWIRSLNCVVSGRPAEMAHHVIACGFGGGMGTKIGDNYAIPLTAELHQLLHHDPLEWEKVHGKQVDHLDRIVELAKEEGMLTGFDSWSVGLGDD